MQSIHLKKEPDLSLKHDGFIYQVEAVNAMKDLTYGAIFHEQGLGKTKIAIDIMAYWLKNKLIDTVIFLTKRGLVENWKDELKTHTYMKPSILTNNVMNNFYVFNSPTRLILTHFEVIEKEHSRLKEYFLKTRNVAIIIDESAKIKNPESKLTQTLFDLATLFKKRIIMTGTPVANRPQDIWSQIYFLDQGESLGTDFNEFKRQCDLSNKLSIDVDKQEEFSLFVSTIFPKLRNFSVRETKNSGKISLPTKTIVNQYCDFESIQYDMYRSVAEEMKIYITRNGIPTEDDDSETLKRMLRLIQVCSNPRLIDDHYISESGKEEILEQLLDIIMDRQEKVIIWTSFTENVDYLTNKLRYLNAVKVHGKLSFSERNESIKDFKNDPECRVLIATPASAKEGLTLTVANNAIFFDRNLSLDDYLQAQDRIHRISQKKECFIYNLIIKNSIDDWVESLLQSKHLSAQLAQGDITRETFEANINYDFGSLIKSILNTQEK